MVAPEDLFAAAEELAAKDLEVWWRSAASRAYYAAFHHLRVIVEERVGLPRFGTSDDHRDLIASLRMLDEAVAAALVALRQERNSADYALESGFSRTRALSSVAVARRILDWD